MLAAIVGGILRRVVIDDLDVADQTGSNVRTLDQIVRQQCISRETALQHLVQDADFIDALAGEDPFPEEVLVDIRDSARVDVVAGLSRINGGQA